jgi:hypothetical protein
MPIEVKSIEQVQDELYAAVLAVLDANGIANADVRMGTLIGAAVGYAKAQFVTRREFRAHVEQCMSLLDMADA